MTKRAIIAVAAFLFAFSSAGYAQTNSPGVATNALAGVAEGSLPGLETNTADGSSRGISFGVKVGTLGPGAEASVALSDSIGIRLGANYLAYDSTETEDDIEYDVDLSLMTVSALVDWHPFQGAFRVSGGVMYNGNDFDAEARSATSFQIGDLTYTSAQIGTLKGEIDFDDIAPYAGLGWDTSFGKDGAFGLIVDLGVMYQGSPEIDLSSVGGTLSGTPGLEAELAKEEQNIQDDLDDFKFYPVASIGLSYRF